MLTFDAEPHVYRFNGTPVPSVTQVLGSACGDQFWRIKPEVLERKRALGTAIHFACELDDNGTLDENTVHDEVQPYLQAWRAFRAETRCDVLVSEHRLYHSVYGYAGTADRLLQINGAIAVCDIKSGLPGILAGLQTAAYLELFDHNGLPRATQRFALQVLPNGRYKFEKFSAPGDWPDFMAALRIHRLKQRLA